MAKKKAVPKKKVVAEKAPAKKPAAKKAAKAVEQREVCTLSYGGQMIDG